MLLPHGLDGAGPEHSSSRIERFLQLTNDRFAPDDAQAHANVNMHVAFPTTPAQYFHLLRRQIKRNFRKPLIVAAPKGLLRLPVRLIATSCYRTPLTKHCSQAASSSLAELTPGTKFQPVLADIDIPADQVQRVVLLSGKIYYELEKERVTRNLGDRVALVRLEELCPFPFPALRDTLARFPADAEVVWLQEEPRNQGAYAHIEPRVRAVLESMERKEKVRYVGRKEAAVPAPGAGKVYAREQAEVVGAAFEGILD